MPRPHRPYLVLIALLICATLAGVAWASALTTIYLPQVYTWATPTSSSS